MFTEVEDRRQCTPCDQLNRISSVERREIVCISATETNEQKSGIQLVAILPHRLSVGLSLRLSLYAVMRT